MGLASRKTDRQRRWVKEKKGAFFKMQEAVLERTVKKPASNPIVADHGI